jgi:hypothetical protein
MAIVRLLRGFGRQHETLCSLFFFLLVFLLLKFFFFRPSLSFLGRFFFVRFCTILRGILFLIFLFLPRITDVPPITLKTTTPLLL